MDRRNPPWGKYEQSLEDMLEVTSSGMKTYARWVRYEEVYNVERLVKQPRKKVSPTISFDDEDCQEVVYPHNDALMVTILVANYTTRMILINDGSSAEILFWDVFSKMGISVEQL